MIEQYHGLRQRRGPHNFLHPNNHSSIESFSDVSQRCDTKLPGLQSFQATEARGAQE